MKTFRVWAKQTAYISLEVKAKTKEEALNIAYGTDAGDFTEDFSKAEHEVIDNMTEVKIAEKNRNVEWRPAK